MFVKVLKKDKKPDEINTARNGKFNKICTGVFQIALWGYVRDLNFENTN